MSTVNFPKAANIVTQVFKAMSEHELFRVSIEGQEIWDLYLASFPEGTNPIFRVRTEHDGSYDRSFIRRLGNVVQLKNIATFSVEGGELKNLKLLDKNIQSETASRVVWGVKTQDFVPVETVMLSPNYWDDQTIGNKHWFFILKDCLNPDSARGIYNEFLKPELEEHRKVFEILGNKTKCEPTEKQLSGVGFSSTNRTSVRMRVKGATINQIYKIII